MNANNATFAAQDAADAKFDFYEFCEDGPGAHAATILAGMEGAQNKAYWDAALSRAMAARADWLAA